MKKLNDSSNKKKNKVLLVIIDGYGFDPIKEKLILSLVFERLPEGVKRVLQKKSEEINTTFLKRGKNVGSIEIFYILLSPTPATLINFEKNNKELDEKALFLFKNEREKLVSLNIEGKNVGEIIDKLIYEESIKHRYAIWAAKSHAVFSMRRSYPTIVTKASGMEVGYEDLKPEVQGNSETGHQQLGNMCVALQPSLEISLSIKNEDFFKNKLLQNCLTKVSNTGINLNICILLSGEAGDDGRVHSCWSHLEALLKLCFSKFHLPPSKLRIQAILDGRDSPKCSSVEGVNGKYNFMHKLELLLGKYSAEESLAWVIGRSISMDRDYDEKKAKTDFRLMVEGEGEKVDGIKGAIKKIKELHSQGYSDPDIYPLVVCDKNGNSQSISKGDVFINLNFRADRQRSKIASLLGAKPFLEREAALKNTKWGMEWIKDDLDLDVYCLTEYHPDLSSQYGAIVIFQTNPHLHNFLDITSKASNKHGFDFKYLFLAESTKALHVGYFFRGRRETIETSQSEERIIIPSYSKEAGINTDNDYYKTPHMKAFEIMGVLANAMYRGIHDLSIVNFSNPDMLGHLISEHFEEVVESIEVIDNILEYLVVLGKKLGFHIILTSDHGNSDENSPAHGSHDILTTFISPKDNLRFRDDIKGKARLFDIPWCILEILELNDFVVPLIPEFPEILKKENLVGKSLVFSS